MFRNLALVQDKWNLQIILSYLSQARDSEEYCEVQANKIIHCIELLVNAFSQQESTGLVESPGHSEDEGFSPSLLKMCRALKMECINNNNQTQEDSLLRIVNEITMLRDSLCQHGTLGLPEQEPEDEKARVTYRYEPYRRLNFLNDFIKDCLRTILDPDEKYVLCPAFIGGHSHQQNEQSSPA